MTYHCDVTDTLNHRSTSPCISQFFVCTYYSNFFVLTGVNLSVSTSNEGSNNSSAIHSQINSPAPPLSQSKPQTNSKTPKKLRNEIRSSNNTKRNTGMMGLYTTGINGMMSPGGTMMTVTSDVDEPYSPIQQQLAALEGPKLSASGSGDPPTSHHHPPTPFTLMIRTLDHPCLT